MRIKLTIQYKGTHFYGWQCQPKLVTVQELLEKSLSRLFNQIIKVMGCSRTDSGVHALMHVSHFDVNIKNDRDQRLNGTQHLRHALNKLLPRDITVLKAESVSDTFHANADCKKKTYVYQIRNDVLRDSFQDEYVWHIPYKLNISAMKKAAQAFKGEHDFKAFAASDGTAKTSVRRIFKIAVKRQTSNVKMARNTFDFLPFDSSLIQIEITASGFLKNMVRNIVGTLVEVGNGKRIPGEIKKVIESRDRRRAGLTAPPEGLFLKEVLY